MGNTSGIPAFFIGSLVSKAIAIAPCTIMRSALTQNGIGSFTDAVLICFDCSFLKDKAVIMGNEALFRDKPFWKGVFSDDAICSDLFSTWQICSLSQCLGLFFDVLH